jgi:hypothetical protein
VGLGEVFSPAAAWKEISFSFVPAALPPERMKERFHDYIYRKFKDSTTRPRDTVARPRRAAESHGMLLEKYIS